MSKNQFEQMKEIFSAFVSTCDDTNEQEFYVTSRMMASIVQDAFEKWLAEEVKKTELPTEKATS